MEDKKVNDVYQTSDYEKFSKLTGNRKLNEQNVIRKMKSIKRYGQLSPILINALKQTIEGQHRLEACRRLGIPVLYIIDGNAGLAEAVECNENQKNWNPYDFAYANAEKGIQPYSILLDFIEKYNFSVSVAIELLAGNVKRDSGGQTDLASFRNGNFKIANYEIADTIAKDVIYYARYFKKNKNLRFVRALSICYYTPKFSPVRMRDKMATISMEANRKLMGSITVRDYTKALDDIYNYNVRKGDKIHFKAE